MWYKVQFRGHGYKREVAQHEATLWAMFLNDAGKAAAAAEQAAGNQVMPGELKMQDTGQQTLDPGDGYTKI